MMRDAIEQFRDAIRFAGLVPPDVIETDGKLHRFSTNGKRSDDAGWYVYHANGVPAGAFGNWRSGLSQRWRADIGRTLTPGEEAEYHVKVERIQREREAAKALEQAEAGSEAAGIWKASTPAPDSHPYLIRKGIKAHGARLHHGALTIPMRSDGEIHSLQFIGEDGKKRFLPGGRVTGCYFIIGNPEDAAALCIAEGYATGASIYEATGYPAAVAFNAGNVLPVAKAMRERFTKLQLIVCADDDTGTQGNPGIAKATEAARAVDGLLAIPVFGTSRLPGVSDFNDMAALHGLEAVKRAIASVKAPDKGTSQSGAQNPTGSDSEGWAEPLPLVAKVAAEPYPLDALPDGIRAAIEEVQAFTKAPIALVVSSALGALSLGAQAYIDMKRAERLQGPSSLFLLTIADSGERKSTCDGFFSSSIRQYQEEQAELMKPVLERHKAEMDAWTAERDGLLSAIKDARKKGTSTDELRSDLAALQRDEPKRPRVPMLLLGDETPENLSWVLSQQWPSGGVMSSEAGLIFGAHAMGKDSIMRNLGLLNLLWDGGTHRVGRRTSESFTLKGARLTVALQIQEATLRSFFDKSGTLARGIGFFARFLVAWPESTQGHRPFSEAPANWPQLAAFHRRIAAILNQRVAIALNLIASLVHLSIVFPSIDSIALGRNHGNEV
jgi:putative DNA primase/helicase